MYVHRSLIDGCQVLGLVADSDLGYCPYTGSPDVTNAAWLGFLLYPVCDALLNPIFRWMGALHRISVYVLPTAGECTTTSRTVPTPRTTPTPPTVPTRTVVAPPVVSTSQTVATPPTVVAQLVVSTPLWLLH